MAPLQRALISVSNKDGIAEFARRLAATGTDILSTGGTARVLREAGVPVRDVAEYTESPEIMDGRVKTLHPRVHGGILARDTRDDQDALTSIGGLPIDLVCVNLYPFEETVARGASHEDTVEHIDIGGPSMVRSAAKNHARVTVLTDPADYPEVLSAAEAGDGPSHGLRARLAAKAFRHTARYDAAIAEYLGGRDDDTRRDAFPDELQVSLRKGYDVRYGENPHQKAAFYVDGTARSGSLARAESVGAGGKELSFNNLVDADAALDAVREHDAPAAVIVKHTNPCGVACAAQLVDAYRAARETDPQSAFGGIVALNRRVDADTAGALAETFLEVVIAPGYEEDALGTLHQKKGLRLLATGDWLEASHSMMQYKRIGDGFVVQERDAAGAGEVEQAQVATQRAPSDEEWRALAFAWRVCKHVKSNAIVLARDEQTVGVGAGQMSRVTSVGIAVEHAGASAEGSVMASDAFFPFPDGVERAARAGVRAVVQPGGSKRDEEVIAAADRAGLAMIMTGRRHFRH